VPTNVPAAQANRGIMMPRRKQTRAQNRTQGIIDERRYNEQALRAEERHGDSENGCGETYSPSRPRPPSGDDPPPF
jgi:hypothetical protein